MRTLLLLSFLSAFSILGYTQGYTTAFGVRLGEQFGFTLNQRILHKVSAEGILQMNLNNSGYGHVLLKKHNSLITRKLNLYMGAGPHFGYGDSYQGIYGVSGMLGVELTALRFSVSLDFLPMVHVGSSLPSDNPDVRNEDQVNTFESQSALSLRYVLVKSNAGHAKNKKQKMRDRRRRHKHRLRAQRGR